MQMEYRTIGRSGLRVSVAGLGCNNFGGRIDFEASRPVIDKALDCGVTLFDTADIYGNRGGSEECLGRILGSRRNRIVLATKFAMAMDDVGVKKGASRRYILDAVEASLKRLRTDWIDLYQVHRPDPETPIEETLRTFENLIRQGKVRYIGCSNFAAWQVIEAQWTAKTCSLDAFISCQNEYSLVVREAEKELIPAMRAYGLGLLPYFPLACGFLSGKYAQGADLPEGTRFSNSPKLAEKYMAEANWQKLNALTSFAEARGRKLLELAIGWLASKPPVVSIIAGATRPEQVEQNVRAVEWVLTSEEIAEVDRLSA
jgi:aryl-alcohol dehydrogenase-like predicted oxidoreductase